MTLPISICEVERNFSKLLIIKHIFWLTMLKEKTGLLYSLYENITKLVPSRICNQKYREKVLERCVRQVVNKATLISYRFLWCCGICHFLKFVNTFLFKSTYWCSHLLCIYNFLFFPSKKVLQNCISFRTHKTWLCPGFLPMNVLVMPQDKFWCAQRRLFLD